MEGNQLFLNLNQYRMNLLLHLYLSGHSPTLVVGGYISNIKSLHDYSAYPADIQSAIRYHELVDEFIYAHPAVVRSRKRINSKYSKYSTTSVDSFYDHFLAANWDKYCVLFIREFCDSVLPYFVRLSKHSAL